MKSIPHILILLLSIVGCSSPEDTSEPEQPNVSSDFTLSILGAKTHTFTSEGGSSQVSFNISHNWTIELDNSRAEEWCDITPQSGTSGNGIITFTVKPNSTYDERRITAILKSGTFEENFYIIQKQKDALLLSSDKVEIGIKGGTISVEVKSNIDYSCKIESDAQSWISRVDARGLASSIETFNIADNTDAIKREGKITFYSEEYSETVTIYQDGEEPVMILTKDKYEIGADGETVQIEVQSNTNYEMQLPSVDWIEESKTRAVSTHTHYIEVKPNDFYDERSAEILFTNKATDKTEKVFIVQKQKDALLVTSDKIEVSQDGEDISIEIQSNIEYKYEIDESALSWISRKETRGLVSHTEIFHVAQNDNVGKREGKIIFRSGDITESVTIYQEGEEPLIVLTNNRYDIGADGETIQIEVQSNINYEMQLPSVDWIEESNTRAVSTHTHYIVVKPNETYEERSAEIQFMDKATNKTENVYIVQKQRNALLVTSNKIEASQEGEDVSIEVQSNTDYEYEIEDAAQSWISRVETRALTPYTETFRIEANTSLQKREGKIIFRSNEIEEAVTISQEGESPVFVISKNTYELDEHGGTIQIDLQTNTDYEMTLPSVNWIEEEATRSVSTKTHYIIVKPNDSYDKRSAEIIFTCPTAEKEIKIRIIQKQCDGLLISSENIQVSYKGGEIEVEVQSNTEYDWEIEEKAKSWITHTNTRSLNSNKLIFSIAENLFLEQRMGEITFTSDSLSETVVISQGGSEANNGGIEDMPTYNW